MQTLHRRMAQDTWLVQGIDVSDLVLTKKACEGTGGQLEAAVVGVLRAGTIAAAIESNVLALRAGGNGLQLRA